MNNLSDRSQIRKSSYIKSTITPQDHKKDFENQCGEKCFLNNEIPAYLGITKNRLAVIKRELKNFPKYDYYFGKHVVVYKKSTIDTWLNANKGGLHRTTKAVYDKNDDRVVGCISPPNTIQDNAAITSFLRMPYARSNHADNA